MRGVSLPTVDGCVFSGAAFSPALEEGSVRVNRTSAYAAIANLTSDMVGLRVMQVVGGKDSGDGLDANAEPHGMQLAGLSPSLRERGRFSRPFAERKATITH